MKITKENSARSISRALRVSPSKLNYVAKSIRNMPVAEAMVQLAFSKRRIAKNVRECLRAAIANAENNHGLDIDELVVSEATVGKAMLMKRIRARAKGRAARIHKFFSNLYITVTQLEGR